MSPQFRKLCRAVRQWQKSREKSTPWSHNYDEQLHCKTKMMQWDRPDSCHGDVIMLGGFHTQPKFWKVYEFIRSRNYLNRKWGPRWSDGWERHDWKGIESCNTCTQAHAGITLVSSLDTFQTMERTKSDQWRPEAASSKVAEGFAGNMMTSRDIQRLCCQRWTKLRFLYWEATYWRT